MKRHVWLVILCLQSYAHADVCEQGLRVTGVLGGDDRRVHQRVRGARREVAEVADRRCDDVQSRFQRLVHQP